MAEAMQFSEMLSSSSMVPKAYQGKPQDILVCVQWGYEMGLAPMQALQNIAVINGKPSVYGDAAMALVQASSVCEDIEEYFEDEGTPNPVAVCVAKRKGRKPVVAKFSVEDAKRAGLWGKQGPWQAYPKRMMQMRARGFALRDAFPDVLKGLITAEEAQDFPEEAKPQITKDITPRNPLDAVSTPAITEQKPEIIEPVLEEPIFENVVLPGTEVVQIEEITVQINEPETEQSQELMAGYPLFVPGREEPFKTLETIKEWSDAYEELADKTARAGKAEPRDRMTKIRELRECNDMVMHKVDAAVRVMHTANYSKRLRALGASQ